VGKVTSLEQNGGPIDALDTDSTLLAEYVALPRRTPRMTPLMASLIRNRMASNDASDGLPHREPDGLE
jgi:hypothetical protein